MLSTGQAMPESYTCFAVMLFIKAQKMVQKTLLNQGLSLPVDCEKVAFIDETNEFLVSTAHASNRRSAMLMQNCWLLTLYKRTLGTEVK